MMLFVMFELQMSRRGKTKVSEFSRASTYSTNLPEKTSLTHLDHIRPDSNLYEQDTFVSALDQGGAVPRARHGVRFEEGAKERHSPGSETGEQKTTTNLGPIDLKSRLYQRPEHNLALKVIRNQEANRAMQASKPNVSTQGADSLVSSSQIMCSRLFLRF